MGGIDKDTITDRHGGNEINFNISPPEFNPNFKPIRSPYQNCSFSSANGELLFYSNGCEVYGSDDEILDGGNMLNPGTQYNEYCPDYGYGGVQAMIVLPDPTNERCFHLFHLDQVYSPNNSLPFIVHSQNFYTTKVSLNDSVENPKVEYKNQSVIEDTNMFVFSLTAVRHGNGQDWWVMIPGVSHLFYYTFLLNEEGPAYKFTQFIDSLDYPLAEGGQAKFSPDGLQYAIYYPKVIYNDRNILMLYQFDRSTGLLSEPLDIPIPFTDFNGAGLEFSPSGQFLYYNTDTSLYQIDTWAEDIPASLTHIADYDGFGDPLPTRFFLQERTPDHRIIMNVTNGSKFLHVIQEPDRKGTACRFEQHAIELPTVNNFTLPHFPNYRLGAIEDPPCDTMVGMEVQPSDDADFSILPNPAYDMITIYPGAEWATIMFVNSSGQEMETFVNDKSIRIESGISHLPAGIYFVVIRFADGNTMSKPFVKL